MEKTKKMSKSSIAIIVLSLLLVLSMVLTLTGAWFTSSDNQTKDSDIVSFGAVDVEVGDTSAIVYSGAEEINTIVDKDTFEATVSFTNNSDVAILYSFKATVDGVYAVTVTEEGYTLGAKDDAKSAWFTNENIAISAHALTAGQPAPEAQTITITFNSNGDANGDEGTYVLRATIEVKAIQAGNLTADDLETVNTELGTSLTTEQLTALVSDAYPEAE